MARQRKTNAEPYNQPFPTRLRALIEENGITQAALSAEIGKSRQMITYYCDGSSSPDLETLVKIAQYFNVSTDYLLGMTDMSTTDVSVKEICKYTGLSEKAISKLHTTIDMLEDGFYNFMFDANDPVDPHIVSHVISMLLCTATRNQMFQLVRYISDMEAIRRELSTFDNDYENDMLWTDDEEFLSHYTDFYNHLRLEYFEINEAFKRILNEMTERESVEKIIQHAVAMVHARMILSDVGKSIPNEAEDNDAEEE